MNITKWEMPKEAKARDKDLYQWFPQADNKTLQTLSPSFRGGRQQALIKLNAVNGETYGKTRNFLNGDVTHLSPYLRHGCISIQDAVDFVREQFGQRAEKLLNEFAWREYWRTVWYTYGSAIMHDMQAPKVALGFNDLPDDIQAASTGLPCVDSFISQLQEVGYLHNHARMWLAAYTVHWRYTDWQQGAQWMHDQLLDGDYASNHLSWQWVSSTFSHKPYFFNQENLAKYTQNQYCESCKAQCPFRDSYAAIEQQLFKPTQQLARAYIPNNHRDIAKRQGNQTIVWVHDEMLNSEHSLLRLPYKKLFIFDPDYYQNWSILRLQFIADCLIEMPMVSVWIGKTSAVIAQLKTQHIITQETPNQLLKQLLAGYSVTWQPEQKVCTKVLKSEDIKSFSKFWKIASEDFIGTSENKQKFIHHRV
jgi:deoxyribodipyrimidine photo-lyase